MSDSPSNGSKKRKADDGTPIIMNKELKESVDRVHKTLTTTEWLLTVDETDMVIPSDNIKGLAMLAEVFAAAMPDADIRINRCKGLIKSMENVLNNPKHVDKLNGMMKKPEETPKKPTVTEMEPSAER